MTRSEPETADFRSHLREKAYVGVRWIIVQSGIQDRFVERLVAAAEAAVAREEIFGPLAPVFRLDTGKEAVAPANDTKCGLDDDLDLKYVCLGGL